MDVIYADELFALNAVLDYVLLLASARLRGAVLRRGRFALAAAAGGMYAVLCVLPGTVWLSSRAVKLGVSLLLALIAWGGEAAFFKSWAIFLALSAAFAGAVYAVSLLAGIPPGEVFVPVSLRVLFLSFGFCYAAVRFFFDRALRRRERVVAAVHLTLAGREASFSALRDTGNELFDPLTARRVLVAEYKALAPLFPLCPPAAAPEDDPASLLRLLSADPSLRGRLRLLPYTAVGTKCALLVCFRPDSLTVAGQKEDLLVALSPTPLSGGGEYAAVV